MCDSGVCQCLPHPAEVSGAYETEGKVALQHRRGNQAHLLSYAHIPEAERTRKWLRLGNCLRDTETVHWRKKRRRRRTQQSSSSQLDAFWILPFVGPVRASAHLEEEEADGGSPGESVSQ